MTQYVTTQKGKMEKGDITAKKKKSQWNHSPKLECQMEYYNCINKYFVKTAEFKKRNGVKCYTP